MLLPALNKAREKAKKIRCTGNLKQIGLACGMYISDYKDFLPLYSDFRSTISPTTWMYWCGLLGELGYIPPSTCGWRESLAGNGYAKDRVFRCPSVKLERNQWTDYGINRYFSGQPTAAVKVLKQCKNISNIIIIADSSRGDEEVGAVSSEGIKDTFTGSWTIPGYDYRMAWPRHNNSLNILFGDFHVAAKTRNEASSLNWY